MSEELGVSRRSFLKTVGVVGAAVAVFPFVNFSQAWAFGEHPQEKLPYPKVIKKVPQVCARACECDCAYNVVVVEDPVTGLERAVTLEGRPEDPVSRGTFCIKGMAFVDSMYDPDRLMVSLKRTNPQRGTDHDPGWVEVKTSDAVKAICDKMKTYTQDEILLCSPGDPYTNRLAKSLGVTRSDQRTECFGTHYYINCLGITNPPNKFYSSTYTPSHHICAYDYGQAKYQLWFGFDSYSKTGKAGIMNHIAEGVRNGCKIVMLNPLRTPLADAFAAEYYPVRPGTDLAVGLAILREMINGKTYQAAFLQEYTDSPALVDVATKKTLGEVENGAWWAWDASAKKAVPLKDCKNPALLGSYDAVIDGKPVKVKTALQVYADTVQDYTPEWAAEISSVPADAIRRMAADLAKAAPNCFIPTLKRDAAGPNYANSWRLRHVIHALNLLNGAMDHEGGVLLLHGVKIPWLEDVEPNKHPYPPQPKNPVDGRREFPVTWNIYDKKDFSAPGHYGLAGYRLYHGKDIKCAFFRNPHRGLFAMTHTQMLEAALEKTELVVDWNLYLDDLGYWCDYVVPAPHQFEEGKFDTRLYFPKWPCYVGGSPVQKSPGDQIGWGAFAKTIGLTLAPKYWTVDGSEDPAKAIKGNLYDPALKNAGAPYATVAEFMDKGKGMWVNKKDYVNYQTLTDIGYGGRARLYFNEFVEVDHEPVPVWAEQWHKTEGDFNLHLLVTRAAWHMHADPNFINNPALRMLSQKNFIDCAWISPKTAEARGLKEGDDIVIENNPKYMPELRRDAKGKVHISKRIRDDCVLLFHGVGHRAKNLKHGAGYGMRDGDLIPQKDTSVVKQHDPTGMGWVEDVYVNVRKA